MVANKAVRPDAKEKRVVLIFPPLTEARLFPYLSLPMITAYLRAHGCPVEQRDLNIELAHALFTEERLRQCGSRGADRSLREAYRTLNASYLLQNYSAIVKDALTPESPEDGSLAIRFFQRGVDMLLEGSLLSRTFTRFDELDDHLQHLADPTEADPGAMVLHDLLSDALGATPPCVVAISVAFFSQLLPAFVLASWVKQRHPSTPVVLGGQQVMLWSSELSRLRAFGTFVDYLGVGKGESTLLPLFHYLQGEQSIESVPDLMTPSGHTPTARTLGAYVALDDCPVPDFSDLPLQKYLSGEVQLPLITCIGCYWGRCVFCSYGNRSLRNRAYEQASPQWIAAACQSLLSQYGSNRINFVDENVNLPLLVSALRLLESRGVQFCFSTRNRLEPALLDKSFCEQLRRAGCVLMSCGYETNSQRLLDIMDKGLDAASFQQIIDNLDAVGITLRLSVMGGLFDETADETMRSHAFLRRNERKLGIDTLQMLVMEPQTFLAESPTQFGLTPSPDGVLRGNALLNYGMGRMGADFSYPATETFESHIDRLVQLHEAIRPARNDEWPAAQAVGTSEAKSLRSIRFHPWVRVLPDPQAPCNDESIILADLAWQRLFRVHSSVVKDSGQLGTALTLVVPATDDSSVWREVLELGLGEPC